MKSRPGVPPLDNHEWKTNVLLRKRGKALFIGGGRRGKQRWKKETDVSSSASFPSYNLSFTHSLREEVLLCVTIQRLLSLLS
jgi:hypothetical protein